MVDLRVHTPSFPICSKKSFLRLNRTSTDIVGHWSSCRLEKKEFAQIQKKMGKASKFRWDWQRKTANNTTKQLNTNQTNNKRKQNKQKTKPKKRHSGDTVGAYMFQHKTIESTTVMPITCYMHCVHHWSYHGWKIIPAKHISALKIENMRGLLSGAKSLVGQILFHINLWLRLSSRMHFAFLSQSQCERAEWNTKLRSSKRSLRG